MDKNKVKAIEEKITGTMKKLEANGFVPFYCSTKEEALKKVKSIVTKGSKTASGGSMTLAECGITDYLKNETSYSEKHRDAYSADFYLCSSNAITENGELYNVDGFSNRTSAMLFGPEKVVVVAGFNKIVPNLKAAVTKVKQDAAPCNAIRLSKDTPCSKNGVCAFPIADENSLFATGCRSDDRICCNAAIMAKQSYVNYGRVTVILVGEYLGY